LANRVSAAEEGQKIRVLITTGGHAFDRKNFFAMWDSFPGMSWRETSQTKTSEAFTPANLDRCDVVAMYDMIPNITADEEVALQAFLKRGGGLVVLHHTICSRQQSPTFERIIGGKFLSKPETRDGKELPKSAATGGVRFRIHVADPKHPITEGLADFDVEDEPYSGMIVNPRNHVLLTSDEPKSNKEIAWTRQEGKARVAFIQLGHDNKTYTNPNYKKIVERAVQWAAAGSKGERQNANSR
jgi:hypothetical protein